MPLRVNPAVLLGLVVVLILSLGISAGAQLTGNSIGGLIGGAQQPAAPASGGLLGIGEAQLGKPFAMGTDGPGTFSCSGLMRYILRTAGVDPNAPWSPEGYLSKYAPVAPGNLQPGDIVIYPDWATMYAGNGMLLNANEMLGEVTLTPMDVAGTPEGIVRPGASGTSTPPPPVGGTTDPSAIPANPSAQQYSPTAGGASSGPLLNSVAPDTSGQPLPTSGAINPSVAAVNPSAQQEAPPSGGAAVDPLLNGGAATDPLAQPLLPAVDPSIQQPPPPPVGEVTPPVPGGIVTPPGG